MKLASIFLFIFVSLVFAATGKAAFCHDTSHKHDHSLLPAVSFLPQPVFNVARDNVGIKEVVPKAYRPRYEKWKADLLSTDFGKQLWLHYAENKEFGLKIVVTQERKNGAGTEDFKWDDNGKLIEATIYLGKDLDKGFPDPVYYPVMNSLGSLPDLVQAGSILASAKLAHELGHVEQISRMNGDVFQNQNKIITAYYRIFLKNGYKASDARLEKLVDELGARPIDIWQDREYWSEVSALNYLVDRLDSSASYCAFMRKMRSNLNNYAENYSSRFDNADRQDVLASCGL